jgi:hypothetical protein
LLKCGQKIKYSLTDFSLYGIHYTNHEEIKMENEFSTLDIVKALQIPRERLRDWMNRSFIEPSVPADGQGTKAVFTLHDVYGVALFRALIDNGFNRETSSRFVKDFIEQEKKEKEKEKNGRIAYPETNYIVIRVPADKKELVQVIHLGAFWGKHYAWSLDLELGYPETEASKAFAPQKEARTGMPRPEKNKNWGFLHVVNFKAIRDKVDEEMKKL